jgi:predicted MFS family arabinose efflux permease
VARKACDGAAASWPPQPDYCSSGERKYLRQHLTPPRYHRCMPAVVEVVVSRNSIDRRNGGEAFEMGGIWQSSRAVLIALTIARIAAGMQFQSVGAVGPAMVKDLSLTYVSLGTLVGAYSLLGLVLSLPAGWLIARLGDRRVVLCGLSLMIMGALLLAAANGLGVALCGRLISGAGGVLLMVALPTIVIGLFDGVALSTAMGTMLSGYPLGIGMAFLLLPAVRSWREAIAATAVLAAAAALAAAMTLARRSADPAVISPHGARPGRGELLPVVAAGLLWGSINAGLTVVLGFGVVYFVGKGLSGGSAGSLVSLAALATVPMGPLGGWLLGRLREPLMGIIGGLGVAVIATGCLVMDVAPAALLITVGIAIGAIAGPVVTLPAAVLEPEHRALGMGFFWVIYFALMTVFPPLAGLTRDLTGNAGAPFYAATVFFGFGLAALGGYVAARRWIVAEADAAGHRGLREPR